MTEERIVHTDDNGGSAAVGAASLIQVIVWAVVVLVLLGVGLFALQHYTHLFG